ncbi:E3 ubiquitin-protein ligase TRIM21-like [Alosa pseudoharengus]|uniref:E3 ubiquitin-protein ligase TRIM21-like n=1 Tax=Alosa pseudoharengus TaxID=34774 RepID=UPI003F8ADF40
MEMTEGIYRPVDPGEVSRPTTDKYEEAGTDTIDVLSKTPNSRDNQEGPDPHHSRPWKSTAVFLGLLCVLLLSVDVTLDPDTAQAKLILSADGKQVRHGDTQQSVPDNPKRFSPVICVLGKQGFSTGRFYYEVQVKGKTDWALGVARESITKKGKISLSPKNGYWTIWLYNGTEYEALASPSVPLSLKEKPQRVGVFVDYEAGLVSFYDADCWYHLYSYANVTFTEKLYPFFYPGVNNGGKNSSPLIISSVSICSIK